MAKEETIGFVGLSTEELVSLDGIPCHICGMIMVKTPITDLPSGETGEQWFCSSCGATTGCTEVKDGEK